MIDAKLDSLSSHERNTDVSTTLFYHLKSNGDKDRQRRGMEGRRKAVRKAATM